MKVTTHNVLIRFKNDRYKCEVVLKYNAIQWRGIQHPFGVRFNVQFSVSRSSIKSFTFEISNTRK